MRFLILSLFTFIVVQYSYGSELELDISEGDYPRQIKESDVKDLEFWDIENLSVEKKNGQIHIGFDDPADAVGTEEEVMPVYRRVRDEIGKEFQKFYKKEISN